MCRINGIWSKEKSPDLEEKCISMRDTLFRGGPDDLGIFTDTKANIAIGHRRLTIIDLSRTGHQPMSTPDGRYTISYNGELYNYKELRQDLMARGIPFMGTSDTEVVLHCFALMGPGCVDLFIGMFAFAIWDSLERSLYLFRDRMGVKPLYYYTHSGTFAFASELKAIHIVLHENLEIDLNSLGEFFHYGYISAPRTIFKHTYKLEPGCWIRVNQDHSVEKHVYWSYRNALNQPPVTGRAVEVEDELEEIMIDAFTKRLVADVPVGVFLSGGVDSSLVTAILARHANENIKTFTIGFNEQGYDESPWARKIAKFLGTNHTEEIVTPDRAREILSMWPNIYDEPFGDISGIPTTIISLVTRKKVKVSLSADGGDELFCGYHRYRVVNRLRKLLGHLPGKVVVTGGKILGILGEKRISQISQVIPELRLPAMQDRVRKFNNMVMHWDKSLSHVYPYAVAYWLPEEVARLTGSYADPRQPVDDSENNNMSSMMMWDIGYYLPDDILTKVDRATMFAGLEGRDPFLDHRIVEFAMRLPFDFKYKNGDSKYILKRILARYIPDELFSRPKQGFAVPVYSWLHKDLISMVDRYLNPDSLRQQNIIDTHTAYKTILKFKTEKGSVAVDRVWLLLVFMMWKELYP